MPLLLVFGAGAVLGGGATLWASDTLGTALKWGAVGAVAYVGYRVLVKT